jgi:hypothetical protein
MAGNWKMYKTAAETGECFREVLSAGGELDALRDRDLSDLRHPTKTVCYVSSRMYHGAAIVYLEVSDAD